MPAAETFRLRPIGNRGCSSPETRDQLSSSFSYPLSTGRDDVCKEEKYEDLSLKQLRETDETKLETT